MELVALGTAVLNCMTHDSCGTLYCSDACRKGAELAYHAEICTKEPDFSAESSISEDHRNFFSTLSLCVCIYAMIRSSYRLESKVFVNQ